MATKQTQKKTSAKRTTRKPAAKTSKTSVKANKPAARSKKSAEVLKKNNEFSYAMSGVWVMIAGILLAIFTYGSAQGVIAGFINDVMFGLFSITAYLVPLIVLAIGIYVFKVKRTNNLVRKICLSIVSVVLVGAMVTLFWQEKLPKISALWNYGIDGLGGGFLGGTVGICLKNLFGKEASIIIILALLAVCMCFIFRVSFTEVFESISKKREEYEDYDDEVPADRATGRIIDAKRKSEEFAESLKENKINPDIFGLGEEEEKKPKKNKKEKKENQEETVFNAEEFLEGVAAQLPKTEGVRELLEEEKRKSKEKEKPKKVASATEEEKEEVAGEIVKSIETPVIEYKMPPIDLLKKVEAVSSDKRREMYETANKLMTVLKNFGVEATLLQVTQGPTVTRYEIQPSTGIKLAKITGLAEDIALNLAVPTVLVAAVPGKAAVGIEVPNNTIGTVSARELMESQAFSDAKSKLSVALGKDIGGNVVIGDISKFPHVLIAGSTGSGKSVCINTIITSILYKARPDEVKLIMVDPKVVELGMYNGIPHLLIPVVTDPKKAAGALNWAVGEMMRRYALFAETGTRNLKGYNEHIEKDGGEKMPQIVIIIDELADLMMVAAKEVEDYICRLAQLARAAGIHLIIATQRPSVDVITGLIKANVPSRIAFAVSSGVDSRTILDKVGAEKLLGKGDMLYHPTGLPNAMRVQGAFVSDEEIESIIEFIKNNSETTNYAQDLADHIERMSTGENGVTDEDESEDADELLPQAIELAQELGQISTSMIQRKMKVGYSRAGRIIDQMEARGLIGSANGSKPREVYLNRIRAAMSGDDDIYDAPEADYDEDYEDDLEEEYEEESEELADYDDE